MIDDGPSCHAAFSVKAAFDSCPADLTAAVTGEKREPSAVMDSLPGAMVDEPNFFIVELF